MEKGSLSIASIHRIQATLLVKYRRNVDFNAISGQFPARVK